jgi:hypothetical protein
MNSIDVRCRTAEEQLEAEGGAGCIDRTRQIDRQDDRNNHEIELQTPETKPLLLPSKWLAGGT